MQLDVAFLPQLVARESAARSVCIVIDILRATTTLTTLLTCGATRVVIAADAADAREEKRADPGAILLGEIGGLRPPDFDLGNSPRDVTPAVVANRRAICSTSNGTAAIRAVAAAPVVLLGCLRNAAAVTAAARAHARRHDLAIMIVCSGGSGGRVFALDDALVAGYLAGLLLGDDRANGLAPMPTDAAIAAEFLCRAELDRATGSAADRWETILRRSGGGPHLAQIGLEGDIPFCAAVDRDTTIPVARVEGQKILVGANIAAAAAPTAPARAAT